MKRVIPRRTAAERRAIQERYYAKMEGERKVHFRLPGATETPCNVQGARVFTTNFAEVSCITCRRELDLLTP